MFGQTAIHTPAGTSRRPRPRATRRAAPAPTPAGRFARAWATAVDGLGVTGAAALVVLVWLLPIGAVAMLARPALRGARRLRLLPTGTSPTTPAAP